MITARGQLADMLRQARADAGFKTHGALAKTMHVDRSVVTRAESETQAVPSDAVIKSWIEATKADPKPILDQAAHCRNGAPEWFVPYLGAEQTATVLRFFHPLVVPGLLQTEAYARAQLTTEGFTGMRLDELLNTRMARKEVIGRARITAVIDSRVLRECMGSPEVMAGQCADLIALAESGNVRVLVIPEDTRVGLGGAFAVASRGSAATVSLTTTIRDITSTAPDVIDDTMNAFEMILAAAMTADASLDFLRTWEERWKERM